MKVACYFDDPRYDYPDRLVTEWRESWSDHGFETAILTEEDARRHPKFQEIDDLVATIPTVNQRRYERACWLRWLAFQLHAPAVCTDYDVINFGLRPEHVPVGDLISLETSISGSCCYATPKGIQGFLDYYPKWKELGAVVTLYGQPHLSDMQVFAATYRGPRLAYSVFTDHPGHFASCCVHFPNGLVCEEWRHANRWKAVSAHRVARFKCASGAEAEKAETEEAMDHEGMLLVVQAFQGQEDLVRRHLPLWQKHGLPIWLLSPIDSPLVVPGVDQNIHIGQNSFSGPRKANRLAATLQLLCVSKYSHFVWFEPDSICLQAEIKPGNGLGGILHGSSEPTRFVSPHFLQTPLLFDRQSAVKMLAAHRRYPMIQEEGHDDRFFSTLAYAGHVPMFNNAPGTFGYNTIAPEHYAAVREAISKGVAWIHGIKDEATLNVVLEAWSQKHTL